MSRHDYGEGTQMRQSFSPQSHLSTRRGKSDSPTSAQGVTAPVYSIPTSTTTGTPQTIRTYTVSHNGRSVTAAENSTERRSKHRQAESQPVIVTRTSRDRRQDDDRRTITYRSKSPRYDSRIFGKGAYDMPDTTYASQGHRQRQHDQSLYNERTTSLDRRGEHGTHRRSYSHSNDVYAPSVINYGDEGYKYTTVGDLVKFDLDQPPQHRAASRHHDGYYSKRGRSYAATDTVENQYYTPYDYRNDTGFLQASSQRDESGGWRVRPNYDSSYRQPTSRNFSSSRNENEYRKEIQRPEKLTRSPSLSQHDAHRVHLYADDRSTPQLNESKRTGRRTGSPAKEFHDEQVENRGFGIFPNRDFHDSHASHRAETTSPSRRHTIGHSSSTIYAAGGADGFPNQRASNKQQRDRNYTTEGSDSLKQSKERINNRSPLKDSLPIGVTALAAYDPAIHGHANSMQIYDEQPLGSFSSPVREDLDRFRAESEAQNDTPPKDRSTRAYSVQRHKQRVHPSPEATYNERERPNAFNPNDTEDLIQLKRDLVALKVQDSAKTQAIQPEKDLLNVPDVRGRVNQAQAENQVRLVSPPRDKSENRPLKGILKQPKVSFPEESNPIREGVAPHKEDKKLKDVPPGARWTKINRKIVNPEALTIGKERFEVRDDFVIVLRVLDKEEIQAYAAATQVLRERRRERDSAEGQQKEPGPAELQRLQTEDEWDVRNRKAVVFDEGGQIVNEVDGKAAKME